MGRLLLVLILVASAVLADSGRVIGWIEIAPGKRVEAHEVGECLVFAQEFYRELGCPIPKMPPGKEGAENVFHLVQEGKIKGFRAISNERTEAPAVWDAIVWSGGPYGHIAVVKEVGSDWVLVVEQNWPGRQGEVRLPLHEKSGTYVIPNRGSYRVLGWCRPLKGRALAESQVVKSSVNDSVALHFILDASGSMRGKYGDALRDAIKQIPRFLDANDTVRVTGFNAEPLVLLEQSKGQVARTSLVRLADDFAPRGKTSLAAAIKGMSGAGAPILVTDGRSTSEEESIAGVPKNLVVVGFGPRSSLANLERMAKAAGVRYLPATPETLADTLFRAVCLQRGEPVIHTTSEWYDPRIPRQFPVQSKAKRLRAFVSYQGAQPAAQLVDPTGKNREVHFTYGAGGLIAEATKPGRWLVQIVPAGREQTHVTFSVSVP